jgi:hypothetical protein
LIDRLPEYPADEKGGDEPKGEGEGHFSYSTLT